MEKEKANPVGWFEIPVIDMDRAETFYKDFLGCECVRQEEKMGILMSWFPASMEIYGAAGTLVKGDMYKPSTASGFRVSARQSTDPRFGTASKSA